MKTYLGYMGDRKYILVGLFVNSQCSYIYLGDGTSGNAGWRDFEKISEIKSLNVRPSLVTEVEL